MAVFPQKQSEITELARKMISGFHYQSDWFPSINWYTLSNVEYQFRLSCEEQNRRQSNLIMATQAKQTAFANLKKTMKRCLKISETDVASDPDKLTLIGWGTRSPATPIKAPTAPTNLHSPQLGAGEVTLQWTRPEASGAVRNYIVKRRDYDTSGQVGSWQIVNFFYDNLITLINQPCGVQMEYLVSASNADGESPASNILPVIL